MWPCKAVSIEPFELRKDLDEPNTLHDFLSKEAVESYKVYGRMEAIVLLGKLFLADSGLGGHNLPTSCISLYIYSRVGGACSEDINRMNLIKSKRNCSAAVKGEGRSYDVAAVGL